MSSAVIQSQLVTTHTNMEYSWPESKSEYAFPEGVGPSFSVTILYVHLGTIYLHQLALPVIQILHIIHKPKAVNTHLPAIYIFPQENSAQRQH